MLVFVPFDRLVVLLFFSYSGSAAIFFQVQSFFFLQNADPRSDAFLNRTELVLLFDHSNGFFGVKFLNFGSHFWFSSFSSCLTFNCTEESLYILYASL